MAILAPGVFDRVANPGRRGVAGQGLTGAFGQNPVQRRAMMPFGNPGFAGNIQGRSDFSGGILGGSMGRRSTFMDRGYDPFDFSRLFEGVSWDPATGLRTKASMPGDSGSTGGTPGGLSNVNPTQWDKAFIDAAKEMSQRYGVNLDPALVKAMAHIESGGTFGMPIRGSDGSDSNPAVGMMQVKPAFWGGLASEIGADIYDPVGNIRTGAAIMAQSMAQGRTWQQALTSTYFTQNDINGTTQQDYINQASEYMKQYSDGKGGLVGGAGWGGSSGNAVVDLATQYVGTQYVWGNIPGASQDPRQTGWDCSGMIKWLSDKMGGNVPAGSHYQYQWAEQTGRLTMDTAQLKPGDLLFFDTSSEAGGGAALNQASHVGMYIGNGQMIHAANEAVGTIITNISDLYYADKFIGGARMDWSGGSGYAGGPSGGGSSTPVNSGIQAANGAYYSLGYQIPTRIPR